MPLAFTSPELPTWNPPAWSAWILFVTMAEPANSSVLSPASEAGWCTAGRAVTLSSALISVYSGWKPGFADGAVVGAVSGVGARRRRSSRRR